MPSEMVSMCGVISSQACLHDNIHLGNRDSFVFFGPLTLLFYIFVFYLRSVGYIAPYKLIFQH